jgi:hypothetical protein
MNLGFREAEVLTTKLHKVLREAAFLEVLEDYNTEQQAEWRALLGLTGGLQPTGNPKPWILQHRADILPCLPSCGADLQTLAAQLSLKLT